MKAMKFQPGTFLEMDDLSGGRKVVTVGRDGATYWDVLDAGRVTPIVIHPSQTPTSLGSIADFVAAHNLQDEIEGVVEHLQQEGLDPENNPLFFMRVLWLLTFKSKELGEGAELYNKLVIAAQVQEAVAVKMHTRAAQYSALH